MRSWCASQIRTIYCAMKAEIVGDSKRHGEDQTACGGAWPSPPALEAGARWFESTHADQFIMPSWLSGDSTALVRRDTNTGGSSPSLGTNIALVSPSATNRVKGNWITCRFDSCQARHLTCHDTLICSTLPLRYTPQSGTPALAAVGSSTAFTKLGITSVC